MGLALDQVKPVLRQAARVVLPRAAAHQLPAGVRSVGIDALLTGPIEDAALIDDPPPQPGLTPDPGDDYLLEPLRVPCRRSRSRWPARSWRRRRRGTARVRQPRR